MHETQELDAIDGFKTPGARVAHPSHAEKGGVYLLKLLRLADSDNGIGHDWTGALIFVALLSFLFVRRLFFPVRPES